MRVSVASLNLWKEGGLPAGEWPRREVALSRLVRLLDADLIGLQEAHPLSLAALDEALPSHDRIRPAA
ncbi:MAG: hypothetical protein SGPRY_010267, partial [Prymnesium sp.]